jgi:general secretion pathway protein A
MILRRLELREQPFGVTPDPRFLFASPTHREALASLLYAIENGLGFITLIASPGMGKTTLLFEVMRRVEATARTAFLFQTISSPADLLRALLIDLDVNEIPDSLIEMQAKLNELLASEAARGRRVVVAIDEAQQLNGAVLETVRMLSNFESASAKRLQIILAGQPRLAQTLAMPEMLQLRQRISIFAHLEPLSVADTTAYIEHRLGIAGRGVTDTLFTAPALRLIAKQSGGIPRNINNLCFNALSLACALRRTTIDSAMIEEVALDLDFTASSCHRNRTRRLPGPMDRCQAKQDLETHPANMRAWLGSPPLRRYGFAALLLATVLAIGWLGVQDFRVISAEEPPYNGPARAWNDGAPQPAEIPLHAAATASSTQARIAEEAATVR